MIDTLVLVRHGKAQTRSDAVPDEERMLTKAGRRALRAWFPRSFSLLEAPKDADVQVWASPAVRAQQTADEVGRVLGVKDVRACESLSQQDADAFWSELEQSNADVVVAVGHNPFMDEFSGRLCGEDLPFATGGVAAFKINDADAEVPARLLWFVQGPQVANWKTVCEIEKTLAERDEALEQRLADAFEQPDDPEATHKFRVAIRTLRSLVAFAEPFVGKSQTKQMLSDLQYVLSYTSDVRDMDVLIEQVRAMEPPAEELLDACMAVREQRRDKMLEALQGKRVRASLARVRKAAHHMKWKRDIGRNGLMPTLVNERYAQMIEALETELASVSLADAKASHTLRKHAKRIRYVSENFAELLNADAAQMAQTMTGLQDKLGALCDARVNVAIISNFPLEGVPERAQWDLTLLKAKSEAYICTVLKQEVPEEPSA